MSAFGRSQGLITLQSCIALDSKPPGGHCLTHVDREGYATQRIVGAIDYPHPPRYCAPIIR